jgi:dTDP-4-amino-4,6-dideoxygalactose transaminase
MSATAKPLVQSPVPEAARNSFPYLDLKAQFETIRHEMSEAIWRVLENQQFILGKEVDQFEADIASIIGARHAVSCASGSDALVLSLMAAGIGTGDEVITSPFTFVATAGSIARVGAIPVFVDIDPATFNILPDVIEAAVTSKTRAIMPVHLFGLPADLDPILETARKHSLVVVEDAAQAIGARYKGRPAGTQGDFGCFSFFPSKNLGGAGDGGLVTTNDAVMADKLRMLRAHGSKKKYQHEILGMNSRLDALQAAILRVKLPHLESWTEGRRLRSRHYADLLEPLKNSGCIQLPSVPGPEYSHVYNQFTIRCQQRDALKDHLRAVGVPTEIYYPGPLHLQSAFRYLGYKAGQLPASEAACAEVLSLPVYPELPDQHQQRVAREITNFFSKAASN